MRRLQIKLARTYVTCNMDWPLLQNSTERLWSNNTEIITNPIMTDQ